jgi:hypothetical protein
MRSRCCARATIGRARSRAADEGDDISPPHGLPPYAKDHSLSHCLLRTVLCITAKFQGRRSLWVLVV